MKLYTLALVFVGLLPMAAAAQMTHPMAPDAPAVNVIKGAQHPELISDSLIARLFSGHSGPKDSDTGDALADKYAHLQDIGMSEPDTQTLSQALATYNRAEAASVVKYNSVTNTAASYATFTQNRDKSATALLSGLKTSLTTDGYKRFIQFLQFEKTNVTIGAQGQ